MIEARLADGTILSFPDGTDQAVVDRVVKQHVMGAAPQDQIDTFGEKAEDVGRAAAAGLGRGAIGLLELPEMAGRLGVRTYQEAKQLLVEKLKRKCLFLTRQREEPCDQA